MEETQQHVELIQAQRALDAAFAVYDEDDERIADCLEKYSSLLKRKGVRLLDAANMEAKAKAIRARIAKVEKPDEVKKNVPEVDSAKNMTTCTECGELISRSVRRCKFCASLQKLSSGASAAPLCLLLGLLFLAGGCIGCNYFLLGYSMVAEGGQTINLGLIADRICGAILSVGLGLAGLLLCNLAAVLSGRG